MIDLKEKRVLVTGFSSMIGRAVANSLHKRGAYILPVFHKNTDLTRYADTMQCIDDAKADMVIHLAGYNGNIDFNRKYPADIFYRTSLINLNVLSACRIYNVQKVVSVLASCAYPDNIPVLKEEDLWGGKCNSSVECHGVAKRTLDIFSRCLRLEYNLNAVTAILNNSFGEYDSTDLNKTKVVMSLIKKYCDARNNNLPEVVNWGSGAPLRQFVYCKDAAEGIVQCLERYDGTYPINIASDTEISIAQLAEKISKFVGYNGKTIWDTNKLDGQMRKCLDLTKMKSILDIKFTNFDKALKNTIDWYDSINIHKRQEKNNE